MRLCGRYWPGSRSRFRVDSISELDDSVPLSLDVFKEEQVLPTTVDIRDLFLMFPPGLTPGRFGASQEHARDHIQCISTLISTDIPLK